MPNRHMGTVRSHNKVHTRKKGGRGLTTTERKAKAHAIHNRGEGADMNGDKQREHKNVRAELGEVVKATAEELDQIRGTLTILGAELVKLRTTLGEERTARLKLAGEQRAYVDDADSNRTQGHLKLYHNYDRTLWTRLRWLFTGRGEN